VTGDVPGTLAQSAGQAVAAAAMTDAWEVTRGRFARLLGRGNARKAKAAERRLARTHRQLAKAAGPDARQLREASAQRWASRFTDLLDKDPAIEAELRALVREVAARLPAGAVPAAGHPVTAGPGVQITASGRETAAGKTRDQWAALLPARERILGLDHPDTLNTRHGLAWWTGMAGDPAAARDQFAALLPIRERVQGPDHPDTLNTRRNLAYWTEKPRDYLLATSSAASPPPPPPSHPTPPPAAAK
jgi:hypothetical protein